MANNFDDKNLFDDSFDLFQSSSNDLFGGGKTAKPVSKEIKSPSMDFNFDNDLFGSSMDNNLFNDKSSTTQSKPQDLPNNLFDFSNDNLFDTASQNTEPAQEPIWSQPQEIAEPSEQVEESPANNEEYFEQNQEIEEAENTDFVSENQEENNIENNVENSKKNKKKKKEKIAEPLENQENEQKIKKEEKPPKTEEEILREKKKKKLILLIASVAVALIFAIVLIVVLTNRPGEKMATPTFEVFQRESGTILVIEEQDGATGYEVVVTQDGKPDTSFASKSGTIELRLYFNEPGVFDVKVRVLGSSASTNSDFSDTQKISNFVKLETPNVFRNDNILSWNKVPNAVSYKLYYRANIIDNTVDYLDLPATESVVTFDMTSLNEYGAGLYPVCVVAIASGEYMMNSDYSKVVNYEYCTALDNPLNVLYDETTHTLTFVTYENRTQAERYMVTVSLDNGTRTENHYVYTLDIESAKITYENAPAIQYTVYLNEIISAEPTHLTIKAIGDGVYSSDSSVVDVNMQ